MDAPQTTDSEGDLTAEERLAQDPVDMAEPAEGAEEAGSGNSN